MKHQLQKLAKSRIKLNIEVPKEDLGKYFQKAYEKLALTVNIKGFRPGKAPKMMVLEAVGQTRYNSEALNLALAETYFEAISKEKLNPINAPAISVQKFAEGNDLIYQAEVDILPEIKLGDYKTIKVKDPRSKAKYEATDKELNIILKRLQYQGASFSDIDRPAKLGDRIEVEFEGAVKGVKKENLCSKNYPLILGEKVLMPDFEEKIVGMKKDEKKEFSLTMPIQSAVPAGRQEKGLKKDKVDFSVKLLNVKETKLPELNDEFAKKFGHDKLVALNDAIKKNIILEKKTKDQNTLEQEILNKIEAKTKLDIPQSLVDQEINRKIAQLQQQSGPAFPEILKKSGKTLEDLRKDIAPQAEKSVKIGLMLGELAKDLGFAKIKPKTEEEQREVIRKTIDKLVELATK